MKLTQALDPIISSLREEKAFLENYLPPKKRLFLGFCLGVLFYFLTGVPLLASLIFGCMVIEDSIDCTIDVRACVLLLIVLLCSNPIDLWVQLLYLILFFLLFQSFHYVSGKNMPMESLEEELPKEGDPFKEHISSDDTLREDIIHLRSLMPTLPLLPFLFSAIVFCSLQPFIQIVSQNTFSEWYLLLGVCIGAVFLYFRDKKKAIQANKVGEERVYGFGDGDVLILSVFGAFYQGGVVFVLWVALVFMLLVYVFIYAKKTFAKKS
jgi:hypothetical protein